MSNALQRLNAEVDRIEERAERRAAMKALPEIARALPIYCDCPNCDEHKPHPAAPAPDAATVNQIMEKLYWLSCGDQDAVREVLRAAVEQLHLTAVNANRAYNAANERAERAELQLTAANLLQREHMVQLLRAERELYDVRNTTLPALRLAAVELLNKAKRAEEELDKLKELLKDALSMWVDENSSLGKRIKEVLK